MLLLSSFTRFLSVFRDFALFSSLTMALVVWVPPAQSKPRTIVFSDIGKATSPADNEPGDPDDNQSMVRLLLHSNELEIPGLVSSLSNSSRLYDDGMFFPN